MLNLFLIHDEIIAHGQFCTDNKALNYEHKVGNTHHIRCNFGSVGLNKTLIRLYHHVLVSLELCNCTNLCFPSCNLGYTA